MPSTTRITTVMMPPFAWQGDKYVAQYKNCTPFGTVEITIVGNSTNKISQYATGDGWLAVEIDTSTFAVGEYRLVARDIQTDSAVPGSFKVYQRQQQPGQAVPRLLNNRFQEIKHIKTGGMATITLARDTKTGKQCIVKKPKSDPDPDLHKIFTDKLAMEAVYLRNFNHPGIIKFIDMFTCENELFLVVEFIDGDDLGYVFAKVSANEGTFLHLARQILAALDYIHCQGMVHRDFNPGNIMMRKDNTIVIIDFGTVKSASASAGSTEVRKPGFEAPEQAMCINDTRTDIYQAGGTLYYMLTCTTPASLAGRDVYSALIRKGISDRTARCIAQALRFDPNQRFQSVKVMSQALGL